MLIRVKLPLIKLLELVPYEQVRVEFIGNKQTYLQIALLIFIFIFRIYRLLYCGCSTVTSIFDSKISVPFALQANQRWGLLLIAWPNAQPPY